MRGNQINVNCFDTIDYKLFKLLQEISYVDTFGKDEVIRKQYKKYLMEKHKIKTSDPVINDVIDRIFVRHQQGMEKFKVTMAANSKSIPEWIEESIQEKIDDICYMSTLKDRIIQRENELLKENDRLREDLQVVYLENGRLNEKIKKLEEHGKQKT